jgi:hypothetical protein
MTTRPENNNNFDEMAVPADLFDKVITRIHVEQRLALIRRRFILVSTALVSSLILTIPVWRIFWSDFVSSGLVEYAKLLFSDFGTVAVYWQDFTLSLLESFPIVGAAAFLSVIFVALSALRSVIRYRQEIRKLMPLVKMH